MKGGSGDGQSGIGTVALSFPFNRDGKEQVSIIGSHLNGGSPRRKTNSRASNDDVKLTSTNIDQYRTWVRCRSRPSARKKDPAASLFSGLRLLDDIVRTPSPKARRRASTSQTLCLPALHTDLQLATCNLQLARGHCFGTSALKKKQKKSSFLDGMSHACRDRNTREQIATRNQMQMPLRSAKTGYVRQGPLGSPDLNNHYSYARSVAVAH